jgi:hypothetical protein
MSVYLTLFKHEVHLSSVPTSYRADGSRGNALDLYSQGTCFEPRPELRVSWWCFSWLASVLQMKCIDKATTTSFQILCQFTIRRYVIAERRAVTCRWSSPAQSFLFSAPVGTHDDIFILFKATYMFWNGASFSTRGGVWFVLSGTANCSV